MEQELAQAIELISAQLGIAVERVFGMFVSAQAFVGIMDILAILSTILLTYVICKKVFVCVGAKERLEHYDIDELVFISFIGMIILSIMVFVVYVAMDIIAGSVLRIACPEYTAMKEMIELAMR